MTFTTRLIQTFSSRYNSLAASVARGQKLPLCCVLTLMTVATASQAHTPVRPALNDSLSHIGQRYATALAQVKQQIQNTQFQQAENPYLFPLLTGANLYDFPLQQTIGTLSDASISSTARTALTESVTNVLLDVYTHQPYLVGHDLTRSVPSPASSSPVQVAPPKAATPPPSIHPPQPVVSEQAVWENEAEANIEVKKPNFWSYVGNFSFQFMQYHVSDNWYKGGENHNSFLAATNLELNYDNKEKLTFANKLEMKLGFQSSANDREHKYKTNADLLRMTNKLGLQASKHWYYTLMLQSWTQFYPGYKSNNPKVFSDFMSPFESILSLGMDYKLSQKNFKINATLSPLAVAFKYVDRTALTSNYGIALGQHHQFKFGSTATISTQWAIMKDVKWQSRLYFFTNYKSTVAEWENTINFKVNKYLSSKLFLFPRFDDGTKRRKGDSYFQFNEYLSVGFDLSF